MRTAVLFDMDGVLLETEILKAQAHSETVCSFGGSVRPEFYASVMGQSHKAVLSAFLNEAGISVTENDYSRVCKGIYTDKLRSDLAMRSGAKELLVALKQRAFELALVTSGLRWMVDFIVGSLGLGNFFRTIVSADDVTREKPAPDAYLRALELLQIAATAAVVVEDSEVGVMSGVTAGCKVIALRHIFNQKHDFSSASRVLTALTPADEVVESICCLLKS